MTIVTVRPNADYYVLNATRTPAGTPLSNSLDNATPLTGEYISFSNGAPDGRGEYIAHMAGETITFTTAHRIRAVRARVDMQNMADPGANVYVTLLIRDPAYGDTPKDWLSSTVAGSIVQRTGRWNTVHPSGGIWGSGGVGRATVRVAPYRPGSGTFPRIHGLYLDVDRKDQPTITPLSVSATNTTRPTVAGTWGTVEGDALNRIRTKVFTPAQVAARGFSPDTSRALWDSKDRPTSQAIQNIGTDLLPGITYTAYMKAAYLVNGVPFWSPWGSVSVVLATEPPTAPDLTVTPDATLARVVLAYQGKVNLLLTADDADFEGSAGNYAAGAGPAPTRSVVQARHGVASLLYTGNGTVNPWFTNTGNAGVGGIPVKRGQTFRLSGFTRAGTTGRAWHLIAREHDTANVYRTQSPAGSNVTNVSTGWSAIPDVTYTVTDDGFLYVQIEAAATPPAAENHYFDQVQVVPGSTAVTWSPGGLVGTTTHSVERWDRSTGLENLATPELARCHDGIYVRTAADSLADSYLFSGAGGTSQQWTITATGSILDLGWVHGSFSEDFALPGAGGLVGVGSAWVRASTSGNYTVLLDCYDGTGTAVGQVGSETWALTTSLQRLDVAGTLPAGTVHVKVVITNNTGVTGQTVYVSGFQWELRPAGSGVTPDPWVPGQGVHPDWQAVRGGNEELLDSSQALTVADAEVPPGIARTYRASSNAVLPGLTENLSSPWTAGSTGAVWLAPTGTWVLKDPYSPDRNAVVRVTGMSEGIEPSTAVFQPAGADLAVGFTDFVGGFGGSITVITLGDTEWSALRTLLMSGNILLLDLPEGGHRYLLIQRAGAPRAGPLGRIQRQVALDVAEVSAPPDLG